VTDRARFGDFLRLAAERLDATDGAPRRVTTGADVQGAVRALLGVITVMSRCIAATDTSARDMAWRHARQPGTWRRARAEARRALGKAADFLRPHAGERPHGGACLTMDTGEDGGQVDGAVRRLAAAALSLQAGHDLLQTHYGRRPDGTREYRSIWAPAIGSDQVTAAMLTELANMAHRAAAKASGIALAPSRGARLATRRDLNLACQWLWVFVAGVRSAQRDEPVPAATRDLLRHIPANILPPRRVPVGGEQVADLCDGAISTAERVRHAAWEFTRHAAWSPAMSITSLSRTAGAATVVSHNCELLLTTLADCEPATKIRQQLLDGAAAAARARESWLTAAHVLGDITTDTRGYLSPAAAETSDLALWTGRLAFASPEWTPASGPRHPARFPASLVASPQDLRHIVTAVHYTCESLTSLARTGRNQIHAAAGASRILVPTRALPDSIDIPYAFATAPHERAASVMSRYRDAAAASNHATSVVAVVAEAVHSPSQILTVARDAVRTGHDGGPRRAPEATLSRGASNQARNLPGPVENVLNQLGVTDPRLLERASTLDSDGAHLIMEAAEGLSSCRARVAVRDVSRSLAAAPIINQVIAATDPRPPLAFCPPEPEHEGQLEAAP